MTPLYAPDVYRSSDHNPGIVGVAFEREAVEEPTLTLSASSVTQTESIDGIGYVGTGFAADTVVIELVDAGGETAVIDPAAVVTDGGFAGLLVYQTDAGEALEMPVGEYTLRAASVDGAEVLASAAFEVVADDDAETPPGDDDADDDGGWSDDDSDGTGSDDSGSGDDQGSGDLPRTGADPALSALVIALLLLAGGTGFLVLRRRRA